MIEAADLPRPGEATDAIERVKRRKVPLAKQQKTSAELEDMVHQKLLIGGAYVSARQDPLLGWRATVITAPKHAKAIQERVATVAAELRKKFTLKA
ncbi:hypothetical protein [Bradyrhizobium sp. Ai1a-2]|uniref:hypothetical protein n=1 Tax=Bradyrhizobium sp. Ai1a-2 TaxID=196490 RepID=UPI00040CA48F|nr:hypothetical protein [Bradyrhizobium sp. Ai1a-2]